MTSNIILHRNEFIRMLKFQDVRTHRLEDHNLLRKLKIMEFHHFIRVD